MRIIMMGSPDFAVPTLDALARSEHDVVAAYCQPPRPAGRGKKDQPTAVQARAEELGIPVRYPENFKSDAAREAFADFDADVAVVAAYGLILPQAILDAPRMGCINVHASILPRWRGAAPVQRAIMSGDATTGVTLMQMKKGLDTGPMLMTRETVIGDKDAGMLTDELALMGGAMVIEWLEDPSRFRPVAQPASGATYAAKIDKAEARIDWTRDAADVARHVQGLSPWPGAWTMAGETRLKILQAEKASGDGAPGTLLDDALTVACGKGALRVTRAQRPGKGVQDAAELLRGFALPEGTQLT